MSIPKELEKEIDQAIFETMTPDPFCPRCKKLEKENRKWSEWNEKIGKKMKFFHDFFQSFSCY